MSDVNDDVRNLYVIRRRLAELRRLPNESAFKYYVGNFMVCIWTYRVMESPITNPIDRITLHDAVDVSVHEYSKDDNKHPKHIDLEMDSRFAHYTPIKYREWQGYSSGKEMPLAHLCELIKYLHRLSNLLIFT
jgi:hypothetical protein